MNNLNIKLHEYQKQILSKLVSSIGLRFNDLILEGLESEHMNYHLKRLLDYKLVEKKNEKYQLTNKGKDYSNLMDDEVEFIEKQPKVSVLLNVVRKNEKGEVEHLVSRRLRHPYFGKIGLLTGKVQFGETLEQAALRELFEEAGLTAKTVILEQVYHKLRKNTEVEYVQDNIFFKFFVTDVSGEFIKKTRHQENLWLTKDDMAKTDQYDFFEGLALDGRFTPESISFFEDNATTEDY